MFKGKRHFPYENGIEAVHGFNEHNRSPKRQCMQHLHAVTSGNTIVSHHQQQSCFVDAQLSTVQASNNIPYNNNVPYNNNNNNVPNNNNNVPYNNKSDVTGLSDMECDTYSLLSHQFQSGMVRNSAQSSLDMEVPMHENNNNNNINSDMYITPTSVCLRCQAGEPGHYGHIGR